MYGVKGFLFIESRHLRKICIFHIQSHIQDCPDGKVTCTNDTCEHVCARRGMSVHLEKCPRRLEPCQKCGCRLLFSELAVSIYVLYKLLNKRNPYLTSVAYYLDFGNYNPHYLVPNCSAINLESNDGNHKRFAIIHVTRVGQVQGGGGSLAKSGSFSTSMVTIRNNLCANFGGGIMVWAEITGHGKIW